MLLRVRFLVNVGCAVAILALAPVPSRAQHALMSAPASSAGSRLMEVRPGPTERSARVGVHRTDAAQQQGRVAVVSGIGGDARRNVVIAASVLLVTAIIVGGETGWKLGAAAGLIGLAVAVS
jgi:hypothetical protein